MKTILLLLLSISCQSQVTKKILYQGKSYNFRIERMTDHDSTAVYFYFTSQISKNSNGKLNIQTVKIEELKYLVAELRLFALYDEKNTYYTRYLSFDILKAENSVEIVLGDNVSGWIKLSKTSCKSLATEIENNIKLMN